MKLYGAIDLHSTNNVTVVINEQDQVVYQKRLPNDLSLIAQQLSSYQASLRVSWWSQPITGTGW
jgi:transposase